MVSVSDFSTGPRYTNSCRKTGPAWFNHQLSFPQYEDSLIRHIQLNFCSSTIRCGNLLRRTLCHLECGMCNTSFSSIEFILDIVLQSCNIGRYADLSRHLAWFATDGGKLTISKPWSANSRACAPLVQNMPLFLPLAWAALFIFSIAVRSSSGMPVVIGWPI